MVLVDGYSGFYVGSDGGKPKIREACISCIVYQDTGLGHWSVDQATFFCGIHMPLSGLHEQRDESGGILEPQRHRVTYNGVRKLHRVTGITYKSEPICVWVLLYVFHYIPTRHPIRDEL